MAPALAASHPLSRTHAGAMMALLCLVQFMLVLDVSIINIALANLQRDLDLAPSTLQWVVSAYALTFGGFLILAGRAADLWGRRRFFLIGLTLFSKERTSWHTFRLSWAARDRAATARRWPAGSWSAQPADPT